MSARVDRIEPVEPAAHVRLDEHCVDSCPWCGDELIDEKCARNCNASRVNRTDAR